MASAAEPSASSSAAGGASSSAAEEGTGKGPITLICIGMAGSGKTTFMQRLNAEVYTRKQPSYIINLDPATAELPYTAQIDIRQTVKYKEVMKQYELGPNGGILTSLNLFTTKFDQVLDLVGKRAKNLKYLLIDTPGQIEIFTWSASGAIITEALAASYPTVVVYIVDTPRCTSPATFMSNMLYACSILYKTKLPFVLVFNKTDVVSHEFALEWMTDDDAFRAAVEGETSMMGSLVKSMSLVLQEFYAKLRCVGASAMTGEGMDEFFEAVADAAEEHETVYRPELERRRKERQEKEELARKAQLEKFQADLLAGKLDERRPAPQPDEEFESPYHGEDDDADYEGGFDEGDVEDAEEERPETEAYAFLRLMQQQRDAAARDERP